MTETVLVTGGTGYVAGWCVTELLRRGYAVRTTVRGLAKESAVRRVAPDAGETLTVLAADLTADAGWDAAMTGCDHVLHVASPLGITRSKDPNELIVPARDGTLRVLRAAVRAGVRRVVLTGQQTQSLGSLGIAWGRHHLGATVSRPGWNLLPLTLAVEPHLGDDYGRPAMPSSDLDQQATPADPSIDEGVVLTIAVHRDTTVPALVVEVTGELDTLTAPRLLDTLHEALRESCPVVVVDLTGVGFMGSAGLAVLVEAHDHAGSSTSLRIVAPARATLRPIQITGLDAMLNLYPSRPDALTPPADPSP